MGGCKERGLGIELMGPRLLQLSSYTTIHLMVKFDFSLAKTLSLFDILKEKMGKKKRDNSAASWQ